MTDAKHLEQSLNDLRAQIRGLDIDDEPTRLRLARLLADIEQTLGDPADAHAHRNLGERLRASIVHFEVTHPRIAVLMNELMTQLSNMGI